MGLLSPTAGATQATLVKNVARLLGDVPYTEIHTNDPPNPATSLTVASDATTRYEPGFYIDWMDDGSYDIAIITAVAATSLTVVAGQLGSTAADHAANARFRKNPRFWAKDIDKAIGDAIAGDLYPKIFAIYDTTLTPSATNVYYSLPAAAEDVISVYQKPATGNDLMFLSGWSVPRYVDTVLSATGKAIRIPALRHSSNSIFVQYTQIPAIGDLSEAQVRIIEYGACARLLEREGGEDVAKDRPQSGTLVPGQAIRDARWFRQEQEEMIAKERNILQRRFPARKRAFIGGPHFGDAGQNSYFDSIGS